MFDKLRKILVKDAFKTPEYQQVFKDVIGYEDIKLLLYKMITSKYTNSVLLAGPPASSKTVFILELLDHFKGKAYFVDGTTVSGMGIIDYLFDHTDLKFLLIDEIDKLNKNDQKVLLNVMETGILSDVRAKRSKSARQTHMHLSIYATSNDISNMLTPLLSRFIKLNLPEYSLEAFAEICQKLLSRKYDKDHETIQAIVQYVWEHTKDGREAIAIAKIADTSDVGLWSDRDYNHAVTISNSLRTPTFNKFEKWYEKQTEPIIENSVKEAENELSNIRGYRRIQRQRQYHN